MLCGEDGGAGTHPSASRDRMLGVTEAGALPKSRQQRVHLELHTHVSATPCNGNTTLLPLFACQGNPSGLVLGQGSRKPGKNLALFLQVWTHKRKIRRTLALSFSPTERQSGSGTGLRVSFVPHSHQNGWSVLGLCSP